MSPEALKNLSWETHSSGAFSPQMFPEEPAGVFVHNLSILLSLVNWEFRAIIKSILPEFPVRNEWGKYLCGCEVEWMVRQWSNNNPERYDKSYNLTSSGASERFWSRLSPVFVAQISRNKNWCSIIFKFQDGASFWLTHFLENFFHD